MSQQINLFDKVTRKQKTAFSLDGMARGQIAILLCALLFYTYTAYQTTSLKQEVDAGNTSLAAEQARLDGLAENFSRQRSGLTLEQELHNTEAEVAAQREIINALKSGVIGNTKGFSEYMQAFARQVINGLWLTGFNIEGDAKQMSLSGAALTPELVPGYIIRLNNEQAMRGKIFTSLYMQLPKVDEKKPASTQYIEFDLQSVVPGEDEE